MKSFDGYRELVLADMALNDKGQVVPRDDYEARQEMIEAMRRDKLRTAQTRGMLVVCGVVCAAIIIGHLFF